MTNMLAFNIIFLVYVNKKINELKGNESNVLFLFLIHVDVSEGAGRAVINAHILPNNIILS